MASVQMLLGPCDAVYNKSNGIMASKRFYDTSESCNSAPKPPDAPYGEERTPRRPQDNYDTLATVVTFSKFALNFGPGRAPYRESWICDMLLAGRIIDKCVQINGFFTKYKIDDKSCGIWCPVAPNTACFECFLNCKLKS